jgi:hypothetical protein
VRLFADNFTSDTFSDGVTYERIAGTSTLAWEETTFGSGSLGRLRVTGPGTSAWKLNGPRVKNGVASVTWNHSTGAYTTMDFGAIVKGLDANNFILCQCSKVNNRFEIWKYDSGVWTMLNTYVPGSPNWTNGTMQVSAYVYGNTVRCAANVGSAITDYNGSASNDAFTYTLAGADATKFGSGVKGWTGFRINTDGTNREYITNFGVESSIADGSSFTQNGAAHEGHLYFVGAGADDGANAKAVVNQFENNVETLYLGDVSPATTAAGFTTGFDGVYKGIKPQVRPLPGADDWALGDVGRHTAPGMYDDFWGAKAKPDGNHHHYAFWSVLPTLKPIRVIVLNTEEQGGGDLSENQLAFLDYELDKNPTNPKVVVSHRPRYSATSVGGKGDQANLDSAWQLMKGRTSLLISAHSRNYQRHNPRDGITQIITGAGGMALEAISGGYAGVAYSNAATFGVLRMKRATTSVNNTVLLEWVNAAGVVADSVTLDLSPAAIPAPIDTALDHPWKFVLTSADALTNYGEITNARERSVSDPHMGTPSLSCTIRIDHELADTVINEECLIKAYRGSRLVFHGPVVTVEEVGEATGQNIRITAAGAWWRASKRIIPASTTENGLSYPANFSTSREQVMPWLLNYANGYNVTNGTPFTEDRNWFTGIQWNGGNP